MANIEYRRNAKSLFLENLLNLYYIRIHWWGLHLHPGGGADPQPSVHLPCQRRAAFRGCSEPGAQVRSPFSLQRLSKVGPLRSTQAAEVAEQLGQASKGLHLHSGGRANPQLSMQLPYQRRTCLQEVSDLGTQVRSSFSLSKATL